MEIINQNPNLINMNQLKIDRDFYHYFWKHIEH